MLSLLLLRHAKATQDRSGADIDRPLSTRGLHDAAQTGERMAESGLVPERILCSAALRARQTLSSALPSLLPAMPQSADIALLAELYAAGDYRRIAGARGGGAQSLLLIGHNPATHQAAISLAGSGDASLLEALRGGFPTCGLAVIEFRAPDWQQIVPGAGRLAAFLRPE